MKFKLPTAAPSTSPPQATPSPSTGLKLNLGGVQQKPTSKASNSPAVPAPILKSVKKRPRDQADDGSRPRKISRKLSLKIPKKLVQSPGSGLKIKTTLPQTPSGRLKIKNKGIFGRPPVRPLGVGYDSEAEGAEEDPAIEENFILRMEPGPDCELLREAIENRKVGVPRNEGGVDVTIKFFTKDARRAAIKVQDRIYSAVLVDLPCIVESMKSWDRKGWWKSADICQMLLVTGKIKSEDAAKTAPLPKEMDEKTWQWPHGLTPPMYNVRKRRFRKRVSYRTIEAAEAEVERLLEADEQARKHGGFSKAEIIDLAQEQEDAEAEEEDEGGEQEEDEDAEGEFEVDENGYAYVEQDAEAEEEDDEEAVAAMAARMEAELGGVVEFDSEGMAIDSSPAVATPVEASQIPIASIESGTPAVDTSGVSGESDEEEEEDEAEDEDEDEDEEEEDDDEIDEESRERNQQLIQQREEIAHMERQLNERRLQLERTTNQLFKARISGQIKTLEAEIGVKKRGLGDTEDDA